jgi:hypothetical protein
MNGERRIELDRVQNGALKQIAGLLQKLSYRDMQKLAQTFDAKNGADRTTAERFLVVADEILAETETPAPSHHRG